jgi:hypothetical protein
LMDGVRHRRVKKANAATSAPTASSHLLEHDNFWQEANDDDKYHGTAPSSAGSASQGLSRFITVRF